jgi:hypothetical protein
MVKFVKIRNGNPEFIARVFAHAVYGLKRRKRIAEPYWPYTKAPPVVVCGVMDFMSIDHVNPLDKN